MCQAAAKKPSERLSGAPKKDAACFYLLELLYCLLPFNTLVSRRAFTTSNLYLRRASLEIGFS